MSNAGKDDNGVSSLLGVSSTDATAVTPVYANPSTHRLLVEGIITSNVSAQATSPVTVASGDTGKTFTNEGASGKITFNLPTAVANLMYTFFVQDSDGIDITASTGDTIRFSGTVTATAGTITSTTVGSSITLVSINATEWVAVDLIGTWA